MRILTKLVSHLTERKDVFSGKIIGVENYGNFLSVLLIQSEERREEVYFFGRIEETRYIKKFVVFTNVTRGIIKRHLEQIVEVDRDKKRRSLDSCSADYAVDAISRNYQFVTEILRKYLQDRERMFSAHLT